MDSNQDYSMKKILIIIWISIGGWIGWWIGEYIGTMTAYLLSVLGAAAGLYFGKKIMTNFME
jgi:hypothetical protein